MAVLLLRSSVLVAITFWSAQVVASCPVEVTCAAVRGVVSECESVPGADGSLFKVLLSQSAVSGGPCSEPASTTERQRAEAWIAAYSQVSNWYVTGTSLATCTSLVGSPALFRVVRACCDTTPASAVCERGGLSLELFGDEG